MSTSDGSDGSSDGGSDVGLALTTDGRVLHGGALRYGFRSFPDCLKVLPTKGSISDPAKLSDLLRSDCAAAFTARAVGETGGDGDSSEDGDGGGGPDVGGPDGEEEKYSQGDTFFVSADASPRCALEELALQIFSFHSRDAKFDAATSGAEFWTQVIDTDADIQWHWDRDYALEDAGIALSPHLATVTYLSGLDAVGLSLQQKGGHAGVQLDAPTLVIPQTAPLELANRSLPGGGLVDSFVVSIPRCGKHMCFDGQFLHGAMEEVSSALAATRGSEPPQKRSRGVDTFAGVNENGATTTTEEPESLHTDTGLRKRVTFLVNVWLNHVPVTATPLPDSFLGQMQAPVGSFSMDLRDEAAATPYKVSDVGGEAASLGWQFPGGPVAEAGSSGEEDSIDSEGECEAATGGGKSLAESSESSSESEEGRLWTYDLTIQLPLDSMAKALNSGVDSFEIHRPAIAKLQIA